MDFSFCVTDAYDAMAGHNKVPEAFVINGMAIRPFAGTVGTTGGESKD
jgi:hypothetical protein